MLGTGTWEQRKLGNIASKVNEKNRNSEYRTVLTNSATKGIIRQTDYFDRKIAQNVENYYIVRDQYFIYNPRISVSAPYGPIRINRLGITGVMSPLYVVFSVNNIDNVFLEYFFKTSFWYKFMYENGDSGARADRFAIKDNTFFSMPITIPETKEQARIGKVLDRVDNLIAANEYNLKNALSI
ncbi:restriction endonuclease subunit S [Lactiplantibacillus argentoratensis]|uniref:restriction endonuclease subunit S n=1 Tax=Lactiplantibacillus argentoratensis TaxID=271881 RepID=UPI001CE22AB6|nr:restriction endonuclease subunit S [Lactiplantibacillus argentoratensis]MCA5598089.1 restriction endonuclease subunit S [Lactiplantibacillus argentoratensis]